MKAALEETDRRRAIQIAYNEEHGITPQSIVKGISDITEFLMSESKVPEEGQARAASRKKGDEPMRTGARAADRRARGGDGRRGRRPAVRVRGAPARRDPRPAPRAARPAGGDAHERGHRLPARAMPPPGRTEDRRRRRALGGRRAEPAAADVARRRAPTAPSRWTSAAPGRRRRHAAAPGHVARAAPRWSTSSSGWRIVAAFAAVGAIAFVGGVGRRDRRAHRRRDHRRPASSLAYAPFMIATRRRPDPRPPRRRNTRIVRADGVAR